MKIFILFFSIFVFSLSILDRQYYKALRVPVSATPQQIKQNYRKLSRKYHPDRNPSPQAKSKFQKINVAYQTLYNPQSKYLYDRLGKQKMNDPNVQQQKNLQSLKGSTIQIKFTLTLQDLYKGKNLTGTFFKKTACPHCLGSGAQNSYDIVRCSQCQGQGKKTKRVNVGGGYYNMASQTCNRCHGQGKIIGRKCNTCTGNKIVQGFEEFNLLIQPGTRHFDKIKFINMGDQMMQGAPGDLIIRINQARNPRFNRIGNDLHTQIYLSLKQALFGFNRTIEQLDGRLLQISHNKITQPNEIIRLEGQGMPIKGSSEKGDMIVNVRVYIPRYDENQLNQLEIVFQKLQ